jgi:hypothetical protein
MATKSTSFQQVPAADAQPLRKMRVGIIAALLGGCAIMITACAPVAPASSSQKVTGNCATDWSCSDNNNDPPPDMTPPVPIGYDLGLTDAAVATTTPPGQTGCHGYGACYGTCNTTSTTNAQFASCAAACDAHASTAAATALNNTFNCGVNACMGIGWCTSINDQSDNCGYCAYNAVSAIFGMPCDNGAPMCNASQCQAQVSACLAATP